jgi:hypothetical protein
MDTNTSPFIQSQASPFLQPQAPTFSGQPQAPTFNPLFDMTAIQKQLDAIPTDMSGINAYRAEALRTGPSAWANLSKISSAAQQANQREASLREAAAQTAGEEDRLASSGGLSSGARERAAEAGGKNYLNMSQDLTRQGNLNDLQIGINDETNRVQQLGALPGMENTAMQPLFQKASILTNAQQAQNKALNDWNSNLYNQQMTAWAANQQANATANSGKK